MLTPDDRFSARIDVGLAPGGRLFDAHLGHSGLDGFGHAAERFDFLDVIPGPVHELMRQAST